MSRGKKLKAKKIAISGKHRLFIIKFGDSFITSSFWHHLEIIGSKGRDEKIARYQAYLFSQLSYNIENFRKNSGHILNIKNLYYYKNSNHAYNRVITRKEMSSFKDDVPCAKTYIKSVNFE